MKEKGNIASDEKDLATTMSNFFINIAKDLKLKKKNSKSKFITWLKAFESHQNIEKIEKAINTNENLFVM